MHRSIVIALAALAAGASAQERERPNPTDPRAKVPAVEYRSAFEGYRPFAEQKPAPWRESNEGVKDKKAASPRAADQRQQGPGRER